MKVYSDVLEMYRNTFIYNPVFKKKVILCRGGCLAHYIYNIRYPDAKDVHFACHQKIRFDVFLDRVRNRALPTMDSIEVLRVVKAWDLHPLMRQQEYFPWLKVKDFEYAYMDSSADLFDRKFMHKEEGWVFCCHGTDVDQNKEFKEKYEGQGLLEIEKIEQVYKEFFDWFETTYPGKQVYFIHYPTTLDDRKVYKERGNEILRVMKELESRKKYIHNIDLDDSEIDWDETDEKHFFPYHFSKRTMDAFVKKWIDAEAMQK
jgi:hypothetical protein